MTAQPNVQPNVQPNEPNEPRRRLAQLTRLVPSSRVLSFTAALLAGAILVALWWIVAQPARNVADPAQRLILLLGVTLLLAFAPLIAISVWLLAIARRIDRHHRHQ